MRQSRKKWERRREVHRNKLAAVIFVIIMIAFCVVNRDRNLQFQE